MTVDRIAQLEAEVAALRREAAKGRRWRTALVVAVGALALVAAAKPKGAMETSQVTIVDQGGVQRAILDGTGLRLLDAQGHQHVFLGASDDGGGLLLGDPKSPASSLWMKGGTSTLVVGDAKGNRAVTASGGEKDRGVTVYDDKGTPRVSLKTDGCVIEDEVGNPAP